MEDWEFAGWGKARQISDLGKEPIQITELGVSQEHAHKLGQWQATAICGNDITSSCLYVSALAIMVAGAYAPLALLLVAAVLFLFRKIYSEVGSALPLNGGTYTVLLNTTNKKLAAGAACLTLLSYVATAVISANEAMHYAHQLWHSLDIMGATVILLGVFAVLNLLGIKESAGVALVIFIGHMLTLTLLVVAAGAYVIMDPSTLTMNWQNPLPVETSLPRALFLGFAAAMLGISGFESSANFIEEQKSGVFPKTLRNMWVAVSIFNPLICFLALGLLDLSEVPQHRTSLLATMGERSMGEWLKFVISIDAILVLSGAVLTSYVGVIGLVRRMSLDQCLPQWFLTENKVRKTNHWIIIAFFAFCCAILFITEGKVERLAGVYTISFLCVMALYAIGNMLLKHTRSRLPRAEKASWPIVVIAFIAILIGLSGNLQGDNLKIFAQFFGLVSAIVALMLYRVHLLKAFLFVSSNLIKSVETLNHKMSDKILKEIEQINSRAVVYFTKGDNIANLNSAALYVLQNEQTTNLIVAHVYDRKNDIPKDLVDHLHTIDHMYPQLRIDFLAVKGEFSPEMIERLSRRLGIAKNYMFIGTPGDRFAHEVASLGGVRLII